MEAHARDTSGAVGLAMTRLLRHDPDAVFTAFQSDHIVQNAQQKRLQLINEIDDLKRARLTFVQQLSSLLDTHRTLLDSARGDPTAAPGTAPVEDNVSFFAPPTKRADTKK